MRLNKFLAALALAGLASSLTAQVVPIVPFARTLDLLVVDTTNDRLYRLSDLDQNGDYAGPGEVLVAYDKLLGPFVWSSPSCVFVGPDGTVYVGDVGTDTIYALRDANGDGDMLDANETRIFFDPSNAGGVQMQQSHGITIDALGQMFVAVSNPGSVDGVLRLVDLNLDGDANDPGEASYYYSVPNSASSTAFSIPTKVAVGPDFALYFNDVGTGAGQRGVWRLFDANGDGDCDDAGEANLFWNPAAGSNAQYWSLAFDATGAVYVTDHIGERVWRGVDTDFDGVVDSTTLFYQTTGSTWWDLVVRDDGALWLFDSDGNDRITVLRDLDNDFTALGPGEAVVAYDEGTAATPIRIRGGATQRAPLLSMSPPVVGIGQVTNLVVQTTKPGDLVSPALATGLVPPISVPPYGSLELDPFSVVILGVGVADAFGQFTLPIPIPNNPAILGSYGAQVVAGDPSRYFLSNGTLLTVF